MNKSFILIFMLFWLVSCRKECEVTIERCNENLANDFGYCVDFYKRWFYIKNLNRCVETNYVGYSAKGFASKKECEMCLCNQ